MEPLIKMLETLNKIWNRVPKKWISVQQHQDLGSHTHSFIHQHIAACWGIANTRATK